MVLRELHVAHYNFCTGWTGGEVGDKIGKIGLYRVKKGLTWSLDFTLQAGESQRGVYQGPQKRTATERGLGWWQSWERAFLNSLVQR